MLQELSRLLVKQVRTVDLVARYGGEEFAIILLEIDRTKVLEVANRVRQAVEDMRVTGVHGEELKITASFGLACFPDDATDRGMLIQLADEALYRSKSGGRNTVTMPEPGAGLNRSVVSMLRPVAVPLSGMLRPPVSASPAGALGARARPAAPPAAPDLQKLQEQREALMQSAAPPERPAPAAAPAPASESGRRRNGSERRRRKA